MNKCPAFGRCGGCKYLDKDYSEHLNRKCKKLSKLLAPFGVVENIYGMDNPYHYRNKNTATFKRMKSGDIFAGPYEEGSHRVIDIDNCLLQDERANAIINTIKRLVRSFKITVHNEDTGYGLLRHVMVRTAHATGQIMVVLVTAEVTFPAKKNFVKELVKIHPEITTIVQNINEKHTTMVLGTRNVIMYGRGFIDDILCGKRFKLSPNSFYQINSVQTEVLYDKAIELAGLTGNEVVIDTYCGIGTIGIIAEEHAAEVIGVELNKDAVRDAITNARANACKNIRFYNNDATRFMVNLAKENKHVDVVFMDPPRSGSTPEFMSSVISLAPKKVVYISCGPESLKRDLAFFRNHSDYRVDKIIACDLFPFTEHCEVISLLTRK